MGGYPHKPEFEGYTYITDMLGHTNYKCKIAFLADLTADVYMDSQTVKYGGAALNSSMWATRVGVKATIVSSVGNDTRGKEFLSFIRRQGLSTAGIQKKHGRTSSIEIFLKNGERQYGQWKPGVLETFHLRTKDKILIRGVHAIVVTIYPKYQHILDELAAWKSKLQTAKRPLLVINYGDLKEFHDDVNILKRHEELADILVFGLDKDADEFLINRVREFATATRMCLVTLGKYGSIAWVGGRSFMQPAKHVGITDTTGAGDAFLVGFVVSLLTTKNIQRSLGKGALLAARTIQKVGAY